MFTASITTAAVLYPSLLPAIVLGFQPLLGTTGVATAEAVRSVPEIAAGQRFTIDTADLTDAGELPQLVKSRAGFQHRASSSFQPTLSHVADQLAPWYASAADQLENYSLYVDGWKGPGSIAPTENTRLEALILAHRIASEAPSIAKPLISADEDGSLSFFWDSSDFFASMSIYGDGTYSYYAEGNGAVDDNDNALIDAPLGKDLILTMTGFWIADPIEVNVAA